MQSVMCRDQLVLPAASLSGGGSTLKNSFCNFNIDEDIASRLHVYAGMLNNTDTNNSYMGWEHKLYNYPSFFDTKAPKFDVASKFASGTGTANDPYIIKIKNQLDSLANLVNHGYSFSGEYIKLDSNIVLNDTAQWTPIGKDAPFRGNFDGNNKIISGLFFSENVGYPVGLFGKIDGASISNLGLVGFHIDRAQMAGGIVGSGTGNIKISNSYAIGNITGTTSGGIIGKIEKKFNSDFSNVYFFGNVTGNMAGGIVGTIDSANVTITNTCSVGNISALGDREAGGIIGRVSNTTVTIAKSCFFGKATQKNPSENAIIGYGTAAVTNSFFNSDSAISTLGTGKSTKEAQDIMTYIEAGWNFESLWAIHPDIANGYPFPQKSIFTEGKKPIAKAISIPTIIEQYNNGIPITPKPDSVVYYEDSIPHRLTEDTSYILHHYNNTEIGTNAKIILAGIGDYYGAKFIDFRITNEKRNLANVTVDPIPAQQITAAADSITPIALEPKLVVRDFNETVTLREGIDYSLEYDDNEYTGQATVTIIGKGIYTGSRKTSFQIFGTLPITVTWDTLRTF
ncbi:MAG: hypothetical protein FWC26_02615, partial [Fibromonadales bacterium]|nr:hypothetical protein [Fibromonadales bacterium]